ncbi:mitochondrial ribosomal protein 10 [Annulohypoxylon maeteangense]|uniref:mitochondrial ribosomal protein 10 n=1 Tax=Annulohypoxylon maeteangense TaxID=1927788 RepID=UPI002008E903|nr:mitochondrial ribosomal protein 10 [Annulohypoxylon maeteangense]KAI0885403.1 mitochondrial ribosomal protein 10 [Annulohypoxylon maeteangense]
MSQKPIRLPPLKSLRVHNPNGQRERPCVALMSSVLACWASTGHNAAGCASIEQALRNCMDAPPPPKPKSSEINYHLSRFKNRLTSVEKKKR